MRRFRDLLLVFAIVLVVSAGAFIGYMATSNQPPRERTLGWKAARSMLKARGEIAAALVLPRQGGPALCSKAPCAEGLVYVAGGFEDSFGTVSKRVDVYDPQTNTWKRGPDLPEARHHAAAAALGDTLFVTGGVRSATGFTPEQNVWALRPGRLSFERMANMPEARAGHSAVAANGKLYLLAGAGPSSSVLIFDPNSGWKIGAAMPEPRDHAAAVAVGTKIYVVGGRNAKGVSNRVDIYDTVSNAWSIGPVLPVKDSGMAAGLLSDGYIHVVGGENPSYLGGGVKDIHFELIGGLWIVQPKPILAVHGTPGVVIDGKLLIVGGSRRQGIYSVFGWTGLSQVYDSSVLGGAVTPQPGSSGKPSAQPGQTTPKKKS